MRTRYVMRFYTYCVWAPDILLFPAHVHQQLNSFLRMRTRYSMPHYTYCACASNVLHCPAHAHQQLYSFLRIRNRYSTFFYTFCACASDILALFAFRPNLSHCAPDILRLSILSAHAYQIFYAFLYFLHMRTRYSTLFYIFCTCLPDILHSSIFSAHVHQIFYAFLQFLHVDKIF